MPNVNIPETETITLVWAYQEKRRRQHLKKNDAHTGKRRTGRPRRRWTDNREDMDKYKLTVQEDDGKDWPTKTWRWSLKVKREGEKSTYCK